MKLGLSKINPVLLTRLMCNKPAQAPTPEPERPPSLDSLHKRYRPTELQKFFLVWTKKFKNKDEIPEFVSHDLVDRSRNQARIKLANIIIFMTAVGCGVSVYLGKQAAKRGESVTKMNLEWHEQYKESLSNKKD